MLVQLFDLDLRNGGSLPDFKDVFPEVEKSKAFIGFENSFEWLFDPQVDSAVKSDGNRYLSQEVNCPYALPRFDRFSLRPDSTSPSDLGGAITISSELRVAVLAMWTRYTLPFDALNVKRELQAEILTHYKKQLPTLLNVANGERMFSIVSIRYNAVELEDVLSQEGARLGEVFSGGLDHETETRLRAYVEDNLSIRKYEGLFIRSEEALAVYTAGVEADPEKDLLLYDNHSVPCGSSL